MVEKRKHAMMKYLKEKFRGPTSFPVPRRFCFFFFLRGGSSRDISTENLVHIFFQCIVLTYLYNIYLLCRAMDEEMDLDLQVLAWTGRRVTRHRGRITGFQ